MSPIGLIIIINESKIKIKILHSLVETIVPFYKSTRPNPFSHYLNDVLHPKYNVWTILVVQVELLLRI